MTYQPVENAEIFITACTRDSHERGPCSKYSKNYEENKIRKVLRQFTLRPGTILLLTSLATPIH